MSAPQFPSEQTLDEILVKLHTKVDDAGVRIFKEDSTAEQDWKDAFAEARRALLAYTEREVALAESRILERAYWAVDDAQMRESGAFDAQDAIEKMQKETHDKLMQVRQSLPDGE